MIATLEGSEADSPREIVSNKAWRIHLMQVLTLELNILLLIARN